MLSVLPCTIPRFTVQRSAMVILRAMILFCLLALTLLVPLASASAQGSFTTNKPFLLSVDKTRHFTLTGIPVVYKPLHGSLASGFLTLSGTPDNRSLSLFSTVHLSFSPTINGTPILTDTFPAGVVTAVGTNLYCLASLGSSASGNSFNLHGGFLGSATSSASVFMTPNSWPPAVGASRAVPFRSR